jgi:hypothetical protein
VIGFRSSKTSRAAGGGVLPVEIADRAMTEHYAEPAKASNQIDTSSVHIVNHVTQTIAVQLGIEALSAQPEDFGG